MGIERHPVTAHTSYENLAKWLRASGRFAARTVMSDESAVLICIQHSDRPDSEVVVAVEDGEIEVELIWSEVKFDEGVKFYVPKSKAKYLDLDTEPTVDDVASAIQSLIEGCA